MFKHPCGWTGPQDPLGPPCHTREQMHRLRGPGPGRLWGPVSCLLQAALQIVYGYEAKQLSLILRLICS